MPELVKTQSYRQIEHGGRVFESRNGTDVFIGYRAAPFESEEELHWPLVTKRLGHFSHWPKTMARKFHGYHQAV